MKHLILLTCLAATALVAGPGFIREQAREIPVAGEADVIVVGGTSAGVSAALKAKSAGASVWLLAERPYVGDDIAGTLQLSLPDSSQPEHPLCKAIWLEDASRLVIKSYKADAKFDAKHADPNGDMLTDGRAEDAVHQSVQYNDAQVVITANLDKPQFVCKATAIHFVRANEFDVATAFVSVSADGKTWSDTIPLERRPGMTNDTVDWEANINREVQCIRYGFCRMNGCKRMLLGEIGAIGKTGVRRVIATPLKIKQTFDKALLKAEVRCLTGAYTTDVLFDDNHEFAGVIIADRAGRQAILGRVLIDATSRGTAARLAGAVYPEFKPSEQPYTQIVISGEKPSAEGMSVEALPGEYAAAIQKVTTLVPPNSVDGKAWKCTFRYKCPADTYAAYAEIEQLARDKTFTRQQLDVADSLVFSPARAVSCPPYVFACFEPQFLKAFEAGDKAGAQAAQVVRERVIAGTVHVAAVPLAESDVDKTLDIREQLNGLRPYERAAKTILSPSRALPVLGEYDVVVVGGGTSGAPAAIGAARSGVRTLVIEYLNGLGGVGTLGMIGKYWYGKKVGFTSEHDRGVADLGAAVHVVGKREWWRREIRAAGGEIWFGSMACGAVVEDSCVRGVVVATPYGRGVVLAKQVIDSTGNADLAAVAGARTEFLDDGEIAVQGAGLSPRVLGKSYINSDWGYVNDSDPVDSWMFALRGRLGAGPAWDVSQILETRERRRIKGAIMVSPLDVIRERTFPDTIAQGESDFDTHGPSVADICYVSEATGKKLYTINIPYRAILPEKLDGLAVVGIAAGAHRDAMPFMRMQSDVQNVGYAAGCAAGIAVKHGQELRDIDVRELQRHLAAIGSIPKEALTWHDNHAVDPERWSLAVQNAGDGYKDVPILLDDPERAIPALRIAYQAEQAPVRKLCYAHILGILGDATGSETLLRQLDGSDPAITINALGQTAFGRRMGERDALIVGLGRTRSQQAVPFLLNEIKALNGQTSPQHIRAVSMACEAIAAREFAPALAEALKRPNLSGFVRQGNAAIVPMGGFGGNPEFTRCVKELNLARALLACGDFKGMAREIFEAYAKDPRGILALHARKVLEQYKED